MDDFPFLSKRVSIDFCSITGKRIKTRQHPLNHEGSHCSSICVKINGNEITVSGNPSRFNRPDNLHGFSTVDECMKVYNSILRDLGLPEFTKCSPVRYSESIDKEGNIIELPADGAVIRELHITTNMVVGQGNELAYISAMSTLPYRNSHPHLYPNGMSCTWGSLDGNANCDLVPMIYCKFNDMDIHLLPKILRKFGESSEQYSYVKKLRDYCHSVGVVRFEQKLKSRFLQKHNYHLWGASQMSNLIQLQVDFVTNDKKLKTTATDFDLCTIADRLVEEGICNSYRSANSTASVAMAWMSKKKQFDFNNNGSIKIHRARLRKIGIDIKHACDLTRHSPVQIRRTRDIEVSDLFLPDWYQMPKVPSHLSVVR